MHRFMRDYLSVFHRFNLAQFVSTLGSNLTGFALGIIVFKSSESAGYLGLAAVCQKAPAAAASLLAGSVIDRFPKKSVFLFIGAMSSLNAAWLAVLLYTGKLALWHVFTFLCMASVLRAINDISTLCAIPGLAGKRDLLKSNGMVQMSVGCAVMLAPLLGGELLRSIGSKGIPLCELATIALSAAIVLGLRFPGAADGSTDFRPAILAHVPNGWGFLKAAPVLRSLLAYTCRVNFLVGCSAVLITPLALSYTDERGAGWVLGSGAAGMLLGSCTVLASKGTARSGMALIVLGAVEAIFLATAAFGSKAWMLSASLFCLQFCFPFFAAHSQSIWQRKVPEDLMGRVIALKQAFIWASLTLAYGVAGFFADRVAALQGQGYAFLSGAIRVAFGEASGAHFRATLGLLAVLAGASAAWAIFMTPLGTMDTLIIEKR